ncbi:hypothetical protein N5J77_01945 [Sphingobium yanoikuyae]|uniref:Uncharacterized protein n=1 Tax=Sphingobium yanoikuyae TaxID=13690 RepID=A0AA43B953_SPHYA|nr:hypothetical protein [Sphingobium yanoikuyae]MDH2129870.1 hypothetical protein [Sphingobium yanoikuyae]MDH2147864.1 hypothetical protein [Sphingobium yanoikuyae]MDH2165133.1 hypothetical protein [Sphingobium yanoikuyae]
MQEPDANAGAMAFILAMLQELDTRDPGFAEAVFTRVQADAARHAAAGTHRDDVLAWLNPIRSDFR